MYPRVVVDASVWSSSFISTDIHYDKSNDWILRFIATKGYFVEPSFVRIEIISAVSRVTQNPLMAQRVLSTLSHFPRLSFLPVDDNLISEAIDIAVDFRLRAGDTLYVAVAQQQNIPLVSWDKEQLDRAGRIIPTFTPKTYPF